MATIHNYAQFLLAVLVISKFSNSRTGEFISLRMLHVDEIELVCENLPVPL
jgi:hypothetical protein